MNIEGLKRARGDAGACYAALQGMIGSATPIEALALLPLISMAADLDARIRTVVAAASAPDEARALLVEVETAGYDGLEPDQWLRLEAYLAKTAPPGASAA